MGKTIFLLLYWSIGKIISYASMDSNIRKGDIIMTGTFPGGCIFEKYREGMHWLVYGENNFSVVILDNL